MKETWKIYFLFLCGTGILIFTSCQEAPRDIPFPGDETEFSQPVSAAFTFSEGEKIKWETAKQDSTKPFKELKIDFEKLPSEPFNLSDFKPIPKPIEETKFDLGNLPAEGRLSHRHAKSCCRECALFRDCNNVL